MDKNNEKKFSCSQKFPKKSPSLPLVIAGSTLNHIGERVKPLQQYWKRGKGDMAVLSDFSKNILFAVVGTFQAGRRGIHIHKSPWKTSFSCFCWV